MGDRADRMLCCAIAYRESSVQPSPLPMRFEAEGAVSHMMRVLWHEAKLAMQDPIPAPQDAYMHPIDIDTDEPGIISSKAKQTVHRRRAPFPTVTYERRSDAPVRKQVQTQQCQSLEQARQMAIERTEAHVTSARKQAKSDIRAEVRSAARAEKTRQKREERDRETAEERSTRLEEQKLRREEKKREKQAGGGKEAVSEQEDEATPSSQGDERGTAELEGTVIQSVEDLLEAEADSIGTHHAILPDRGTMGRRKRTFFATPVPFDRHLSALEHVQLHPDLQGSVLEGTPSTNLLIVCGPPGTGKTRNVATSLLPRFSRERVFLCAPTNVGAANLYERVVDVVPDAALLLSHSRIPCGVPVTSQDPNARVVCSTISGRSGPILNGQKFEVVMVDEAGQAMEAWTWSLLRQEVHTLVLTGDTKQLPALVSESGKTMQYGRSMMERLIHLGYPTHLLTVQRRMHPEIARFPNNTFYNGELRTEHSDAATALRPYIVVNVDHDCEQVGTSYVNSAEVEVCVSLVRELEEEFAKVVVVCPYQAQTRELIARGVNNVHTIDSFQGQEADAVVLSVVRNEEIGFWAEERRLNVALTRAKHVLRVVGSSLRWTGLLSSLYVDAKQRNLVVEAENLVRM